MARNLDNITGMKVPESPDDDGAWGPIMDTNLELTDTHNHAPGAGRPIPAAGLGIDGDVSWASNGITNLDRATFVENSAPGAVLRQIFVDTDGNLAYNNGTGIKVRITSGNTLDANQIGGIKGDYGAANAAFYYDDAAGTYRALAQDPTPNVYDTVAMGDCALYPKGESGPQFGVQIKAPSGMLADMPLTFPSALPGSTSLMQVTSAGAIEFSRDPSVDTLATSGNATVGGNLTVSGAVVSPLRLKETSGATDAFIIRVPSGWDTAASGNATVDIPQEAEINLGSAPELGVFGYGTWTPTIIGIDTLTYGTQVGTWWRMGPLVVAQWQVSWSAGATFSDLFVSGLPFGETATWRGQTAVSDAATGIARDATAQRVFSCYVLAGAVGLEALSAGEPVQPVQGYAAGHIRGQVVFFTE